MVLDYLTPLLEARLSMLAVAAVVVQEPQQVVQVEQETALAQVLLDPQLLLRLAEVEQQILVAVEAVQVLMVLVQPLVAQVVLGIS